MPNWLNILRLIKEKQHETQCYKYNTILRIRYTQLHGLQIRTEVDFCVLYSQFFADKFPMFMDGQN